MEFEWNISQDSPHCSSATKSKSSYLKLSVDPSEFHWTDYLHVDVSMTSYGDLKTMNGNANAKRRPRFQKCEKIPSRTMVILRTWITKECGILLMEADHNENGTESQS